MTGVCRWWKAAVAPGSKNCGCLDLVRSWLPTGVWCQIRSNTNLPSMHCDRFCAGEIHLQIYLWLTSEPSFWIFIQTCLFFLPDFQGWIIYGHFIEETVCLTADWQITDAATCKDKMSQTTILDDIMFCRDVRFYTSGSTDFRKHLCLEQISPKITPSSF